MTSVRTYLLLLLALLVLCFGLAADLQPQFRVMRLSRANGDIFAVVLGDSRRMFANEFYVKADAYYHSGFYPTIYDNNEAFKTAHMAVWRAVWPSFGVSERRLFAYEVASERPL